MPRAKSGLLFYSITTILLLGLAYLVAKNIFLPKTLEHYQVTNTSGAVVRSQANQTAKSLTKLNAGHKLVFDSISGNYGVISFNYKPAYVSLADVAMDTVTATRPGPGQHVVGPYGVYEIWTTNNIIAALPDFGFLRGKVANPDLWFWAAAFLLLFSYAIAFRTGRNLSVGSMEWKFLFVMMIGASACQFVYLTSSEEPLSFFSPDVVGWGWAIAHFVLVYIGLSLQLDLLCKMIYLVQRECLISFQARGISYYIWGGALVFAGLFVWDWFKATPPWWYWGIAGALIAIPLMAMLAAALKGREIEPVLTAMPLYAVCGTVLMLCLSIMTIVLVILILTYLMVRTALMFMGEGKLEKDQGGRFIYVFPDGSKSLFNRFSW